MTEYLHKRDIYYVVSALHRMSLALEPPYEPHSYNLVDHRSIKSPVFRDQRKIIANLHQEGVVSIESSFNAKGKTVPFNKALIFVFRRTEGDSLRHLHSKLLLELEEAGLNNIAITEREEIFLSLEGQNIYVQLPLLKLRINKEPLRSNNFPQLFLDYLINEASGALITRESFRLRTSRSFEEVIVKAGFRGKLRATFLPILDKSQVQLLPEVDSDLKNIVAITKQLMKIDDNQTAYDKYMEGIE